MSRSVSKNESKSIVPGDERNMPTIPSDLEQFVAKEVESGRFASRDAVIAHALEFFRRDREESVTGILSGLADVAGGHVQPLEGAFSELRHQLGIHPECK